MAEAEYFGQRAGLSDEWIVSGERAIIFQADDLAGVLVRPLRAILFAALAERDVEKSGAVEQQA